MYITFPFWIDLCRHTNKSVPSCSGSWSCRRLPQKPKASTPWSSCDQARQPPHIFFLNQASKSIIAISFLQRDTFYVPRDVNENSDLCENGNHMIWSDRLAWKSTHAANVSNYPCITDLYPNTAWFDIWFTEKVINFLGLCMRRTTTTTLRSTLLSGCLLFLLWKYMLHFNMWPNDDCGHGLASCWHLT